MNSISQVSLQPIWMSSTIKRVLEPNQVFVSILIKIIALRNEHLVLTMVKLSSKVLIKHPEIKKEMVPPLVIQTHPSKEESVYMQQGITLKPTLFVVNMDSTQQLNHQIRINLIRNSILALTSRKCILMAPTYQSNKRLSIK